MEKLTLQNKGLSSSATIDLNELNKARLVIRALSNKLRKQIIQVISDSNGITVTDIYTKLRLEQSVASQHLGILRRAKIVYAVREGKFIRYHINVIYLHQMNQGIKKIIKLL